MERGNNTAGGRASDTLVSGGQASLGQTGQEAKPRHTSQLTRGLPAEPLTK